MNFSFTTCHRWHYDKLRRVVSIFSLTIKYLRINQSEGEEDERTYTITPNPASFHRYRVVLRIEWKITAIKRSEFSTTPEAHHGLYFPFRVVGVFLSRGEVAKLEAEEVEKQTERERGEGRSQMFETPSD